MNKKIGSVATYLAALALLIIGSIYLTKNSFMPYHADAVQVSWESIDSKMQSLLLALMRAVSGGFIAVGIGMILLQRNFTIGETKSTPFIILLMGLLVSLPTLYATLIIRYNTPGKPPTGLLIFGMVLLVIGFFFNLKTLKEK